MPPTVWTVGHSTRDSDEFPALLSAYRIELVADVRRFPGSRRLPQFEASVLAERLAANGIAYWWFPLLGGRRRPNAASRNVGWRPLARRRGPPSPYAAGAPGSRPPLVHYRTRRRRLTNAAAVGRFKDLRMLRRRFLFNSPAAELWAFVGQE